MASYDHFLMEQPLSFRPAFPDTWISDLFTMESDTLTKALQTSISGDAASSYGSDTSSGLLQSLYSKAGATPAHTPTVSGEAVVSKKRSSVPPNGGGRVAKRKARPSKRVASTTFIAVDPENFMQQVQQVTGVRLGGAGDRLAHSAVVRPEARRAAAEGFPTLDTSAGMLDVSLPSLVSPPYGSAGSSEHYFDYFCSFPTLESSEAA